MKTVVGLDEQMVQQMVALMAMKLVLHLGS
jgi:hypothetical protein